MILKRIKLNFCFNFHKKYLSAFDVSYLRNTEIFYETRKPLTIFLLVKYINLFYHLRHEFKFSELVKYFIRKQLFLSQQSFAIAMLLFEKIGSN